MVRTGESLRIAVVEASEFQRVALHRRLASKGCAPVPYRRTADLLTALRSGWRFDLLLLAPEDTTAWGDLLAACKAQRMPALLIAQDLQWSPPPELATALSGGRLVDFAVSPVADHELEWRMRALLTRARAPVWQAAPAEDLVCGDYRLLARARTALHRGREIQLDPREFELALMLFRNLDHLLTRDFLWVSLWKQMPRKGARALDICAAGVRKKLDLHEQNGIVLRAAYRRGYELRTVAPQAAPASALISFRGA